MLSFLGVLPDWVKLPVAALLGAALVFYPAKWYGATEERQQAQIRAAAEALDRIQNLEKNNANFRNLPARERCLVFMRDSGLPEDNCPER